MKNAEKIEQFLKQSSVSSNPDVNKAVLDELANEMEKSKQTGTRLNIWRIIMKSPITKLAAAAAIILAAGILLFVVEPATVNIAQAAERVRQFDTLIQREHRSVYAAGQTEPGLIMNAVKYVSSDYGSVEEQYDLDGNLMTTTYLLTKEQKIVILTPGSKTYFVMDLSNTALELPEGIDARSLVECIVTEQNPKKLGRKKIDGRTAEGFEAVNPPAMKEMAKLSGGLMTFGDSTWQLWIDVDTKLPIKMEGVLTFEPGPMTQNTRAELEFETTSLEWGAEIDDSIFELNIPDDYTLVDASSFPQ